MSCARATRYITVLIVITAASDLRVSAFSIARPITSDLDTGESARVDIRQAPPKGTQALEETGSEKIIPIVTNTTEEHNVIKTDKDNPSEAPTRSSYEPLTTLTSTYAPEINDTSNKPTTIKENNLSTSDKVIGISASTEFITLSVSNVNQDITDEAASTTPAERESGQTTKNDTAEAGSELNNETSAPSVVTEQVTSLNNLSTTEVTINDSTTLDDVLLTIVTDLPVNENKSAEKIVNYSMPQSITETIPTESTVGATPYWKKYTSIERKRPNIIPEAEKIVKEDKGISTEASTSSDIQTTVPTEVLIGADTAQSSLSIEALKMMSKTSLLGKLKNKLDPPEEKTLDENITISADSGTATLSTVSSTEMASTTSTSEDNTDTTLKHSTLTTTSEIAEENETSKDESTVAIVTEITEKTYAKFTNNSESTTELSSSSMPEESELTNLAPNISKTTVYTSQRGGYLNLTKGLPSNIKNISVKNDATQNATGAETTDENANQHKSSRGLTSQSQLNEDAINEELMKEEVLSDSLHNIKKYRSDADPKKETNTEEKKEPVDIPLPTSESMAQEKSIPETTNSPNQIEDKLSVKPISADKTKNSGLYAVNPNYKPLKKLDVQPPKPFVRDPDDNSWRNESLSSLGIVFKAKNSSKPFTQVLKNKTETELNALPDKLNKDSEPELRTRLEKIAEMRKSKKKKTDGEVTYGDYEESEVIYNEKSKFLDSYFPAMISSTTKPPKPISVESIAEVSKPPSMTFEFTKLEEQELTTRGPKKTYRTESYDDDEVDYVTLANIDLKKYIHNANSKSVVATTSPRVTPLTTPITTTVYTTTKRTYLPDRKPTIQYFPPRPVPKMNDYDDNFKRKINEYTLPESTKKPTSVQMPPVLLVKDDIQTKYNTIRPTDHSRYTSTPTKPGFGNEPNLEYAVVNPDGSFNRASYVIKHLRDFISGADKDSDEENPPYILTEIPFRGAPHDYVQQNKVKTNDYDEYDSHFRKEVLDRFVDNFNQNSERFKVDFPILYNTSIVHSDDSGKAQASSSAFIKRLYDEARRSAHGDPNCERLVELSPEYELHYYVPEQEEREEVDPKAPGLPGLGDAPPPMSYRPRIRT